MINEKGEQRMKKILSLFLAVLMVFCFSATAAAEVAEISFPMIVSTGYITLKGTEMVSTSLVPNTIADDYIVIAENAGCPDITSLKLIIEGERYNTTYVANVEYEFENYLDLVCTQKADKTGDGIYWKLPIKTIVASTNQFLVTGFSRIFTIGISATALIETEEEKVYYEWGTTTMATPVGTNFTIVRPFANASNITDIIRDAITAITSFKFVSKEVHYDYPFIPMTDLDHDGIIVRNEVQLLSGSMLGTGIGEPGFEGLASQVGKFFNKQKNGTITFKVTTAPSTKANVWMNNGIPSSQVGIFNPLTPVNNNIFGLFFNYDTTGSLVSVANLEADGTITFDISQVLSDIGYNSLASIRNIYYGLVGGVGYSDRMVKGYKIDKVILSYDNVVDELGEPEVTTTTTEITTTTTTTTTEEEEEEIVVIDENEDVDTTDEIPLEEDEDIDEPDIIVDEDDDSSDVDNDTDFIDTDEDTNPATGVVFAPIPVIIAAAAMILSKKKK